MILRLPFDEKKINWLDSTLRMQWLDTFSMSESSRINSQNELKETMFELGRFQLMLELKIEIPDK